MPAKRHTISITPISLDGIVVHDKKRPKGSPPQQLNKISAIISFSRNRKMKTTSQSKPLIPGKNHKLSMIQNKGGLRYMTMWNNSELDKMEGNYDSNSIILETKLHNNGEMTYETKEYDVVIGLKRGKSTIVLAVGELAIDGPTHEEVVITLSPLLNNDADQDGNASFSVTSVLKNGNVDRKDAVFPEMQPLSFENDASRTYLLAQNATLKLCVEVMEAESFFKRKLKGMAESKEPNAINSSHSLGNLLKRYTNDNDYLTDDNSDARSIGSRFERNNISSHRSPNHSHIRSPNRPYTTPAYTNQTFRFDDASGISKAEQYIDDGTNPNSQSQFSQSYHGMSEFSSVNGGTFNEAGTYDMDNGRNPYSQSQFSQSYNDGMAGFSSMNGRTFNEGSAYNDGTFYGISVFDNGSMYVSDTFNGTLNPFNNGSVYDSGTFNGTLNQFNGDGRNRIMSMGSYGPPAMGGPNYEEQNWEIMDDFTLSQYGPNNAGFENNDDQFTLSTARNGFDPNTPYYEPMNMNGDFSIGSRPNVVTNIYTNDYTEENDERSFQGSAIASTIASFLGGPDNGQYYDPSLVSYGMNYGAQSQDPSFINNNRISNEYSNSMTYNSANDATQITGATEVTGSNFVTGATEDDPTWTSKGIRRRSNSRNPLKLFGRRGSQRRSQPVGSASFDTHQISQSPKNTSESNENSYDNNLNDDDDETNSKGERNEKSLYDQFMDGIFGNESESNSGSGNDEDEDEEEDDDESSESTDPGPPPMNVQVGAMSVAGLTQITNFTQDSYEKFEKPDFVPAAFGGNGFYRPSSRQRSIRNIPTKDEYTTIGKVMSFGKGRGQRKQMRKKMTRQSRDDYYSSTSDSGSEDYSRR